MERFNGNPNKIMIPHDEVAQVAIRWPGQNLGNRHYWFEFDEDGDCIDTDVPHFVGGEAHNDLLEAARKFWANGR